MEIPLVEEKKFNKIYLRWEAPNLPGKSHHVIENMFAGINDWKGMALRTNRNAQSFRLYNPI